MKNIYLKEELKKLNEYNIELIESIKSTIDILNENYGAHRDIHNDLGGYIVISENIVDIEMLKKGKLQRTKAR